MCRLQYLLTWAVLCVGCAHAWDIAITSGDQIEFYSNQTKTYNEGERFRDLTALAFDAVHNMLLFVDKQSDNASIFSYNLLNKKYQSLVKRRSYENIQGLAFDPVEGILFWTDINEKSIYWISLKPGSKNDVYGNLLIKMDDEIPRAIAVDSCRGYIYWTNTNITKPTIERARFNGSERQVIVNTDIDMAVSLAIDQSTQRLYWADDKEGIHYSIESSDLEGGHRKTLLKGTYHQPNALTVSKDYIYWVDWGFKSVWQLPKDPPSHASPTELVAFLNDHGPFGVVANYPIEDQTKGIPQCENLRSLSQNASNINANFSVPSDGGLFCVHGVKINGKSVCKCTPGYTGDRCDISVCQNFCFQGDCSLTASGEPSCRCNDGYSGLRCEVFVCRAHCLNFGTCSLNKDNEPICSCPEQFEGSRCEIKKELPKIEEPNMSAICNCTKENATRSANLKVSEPTYSMDEFVEASGCDGWDPVRDPVILVLGLLFGVMFVACAILILKIMQLKKRPRIKKRIIVNKNVTPMTARPDQCEITIENCCNMNICETPCFEPRSTIRPTLLDSKPGKEEKKNLINHMEYPDDY